MDEKKKDAKKKADGKKKAEEKKKIDAAKNRKNAEAKLKQAKKDEMKKYEGDPYEVIKFVLMTEKAVRFIEAQNKLVFVVDRKSDKHGIRKAVEAAFQTHISDVNTMIDQKGRKRAFVKFAKPGEAGEIAIRLGII